MQTDVVELCDTLTVILHLSTGAVGVSTVTVDQVGGGVNNGGGSLHSLGLDIGEGELLGLSGF